MIRFIRSLCLLSISILFACAQPAFSMHTSASTQTSFSTQQEEDISTPMLSESNIALRAGTTKALPSAATRPLISCYSSNPKVASLNTSGIINACSTGSADLLYNQAGVLYNIQVTVVDNTAAKNNPFDNTSENSSEDTEEEIAFHIEEEMLFIEAGDSCQISLATDAGSTISSLSTYSFSSSDSSVAKVSSHGEITAIGRGCAVITCSKGNCSDSMYINVISRDYTGKSCDFTMLTASGITRTYTMFKQNAHNYPKYDSYLAWHGCATCSLTTVLGAYNSNYADMLPSSVIDGPEKATVSDSDWTREHVTRSLKQQMPLSMYGISSILSNYGVSNEYIRSYQKEEAKADIINHLKTGNPVIFEVRQKSNITGEKSTRWTNSYHTMIFLGVLTNGKVLVCDSVDRGWSDNGERIKIVEIDDVMEYMYSCTSFNTSMYFNGAASDGGYIKVYESK